MKTEMTLTPKGVTKVEMGNSTLSVVVGPTETC